MFDSATHALSSAIGSCSPSSTLVGCASRRWARTRWADSSADVPVTARNGGSRISRMSGMKAQSFPRDTRVFSAGENNSSCKWLSCNVLFRQQAMVFVDSSGLVKRGCAQSSESERITSCGVVLDRALRPADKKKRRNEPCSCRPDSASRRVAIHAALRPPRTPRTRWRRGVRLALRKALLKKRAPSRRRAMATPEAAIPGALASGGEGRAGA